ncbi:hypothetical protein LQW54_005276 [Pestalotiopsis sp. IQ-011]
MSRTSTAKDLSRSRGSEPDFRRMSTPLLPTNYNYVDNVPSIPRVLSPPPTPRGPPPRPDRLSLRLRSNSGLRMHTNDTALSQYTDYSSPRKTTFTNSIAEHSHQNIDHILSPRSTRPGSRSSMGPQSPGLNSALPFMDLLGKDAFQMAMENPSIIRHLIQYSEESGNEKSVDFLLKIREYNTALNEMTSVLTSISTQYTSIGASTPLNLPHMVSRPLNADIKRIAHSIIPSLENVFFESRSHVENELAQDLFPGFVKRQLVGCTALELASDGSNDDTQLGYPGLGSCFSMTDASDPQHAVVGVSESFEEMTGYLAAEAVGQNCAFLQGPFTDPEAVRRMQIAMRDQRECVELVLNHHKNGEPFWNLLFLLPLKDADGVLQFWLGAQVNVSECMNSRRDLLRVLNGGQPIITDADSSDGSTPRSDHFSGRETPKEGRRSRKNSVAHGRRGSRDAGTSRNWFSTFTKKTPAPSPPSPPPVPEIYDSALGSGSKKSKTSQSSSQRFVSRVKSPVYPTPYSYFMVLRCISSGGSSGQRQTTPSAKKKHSSKLMVSFYNEAVLELLSLPSDIAQEDIFHLLSEQARSPSVSKSFKSSVRESVDQCETISLELLLERGRKRRASTGASNGHRPTALDLQSLRGDSEEKKFAKQSKHERFWSHWTPLRDANGQIDWVVLVISPTS